MLRVLNRFLVNQKSWKRVNKFTAELPYPTAEGLQLDAELYYFAAEQYSPGAELHHLSAEVLHLPAELLY